MLETIQTFKAGKHRAIDGREYEFSEADVSAIAASYDPAVQAAPIVLGHPKTDDPAWGWVKGLTVEDGRLVAATEKVDAAFAEGVEAGRYRYVSAALYAPTDTRNPKPGSWYLRHLGFLGAQPPAVKGLEPAFAEEDPDVVAFAAADGFWVKDILRSLRDWLIEKEGLELADRIVPSWAVDNIDRADAPHFAEGEETAAGSETASSPEDPPGGPEGDPGADSLPGGEDPLAEREAQLAAREAQIAEREAAFAESVRSEQRQEDAEFLDGLVEAGRLPPAQRERVAAIFARLGGDQTVAFAEADADPRAELRSLLDGLGTSIQFAEFSAGDGFDPTSAGAVPQISAAISRLVAEARARGETLSYSQAAAQIGR
ncbi:MAG: hypothetical protein ACK41C_10420 [Phenylobacterium sp.]|uniref:hypothetical protein n=1 Tax=Phenylobacterium sp. TaxID=1871053 RepID=UPI00391B6F5A